MNVPKLIDGNQVSCPQGYGYWDLTCYPCGGSFHRFVTDMILPLDRVIDHYKDGTPRKVTVKSNGKTFGLELR